MLLTTRMALNTSPMHVIYREHVGNLAPSPERKHVSRMISAAPAAVRVTAPWPSAWATGRTGTADLSQGTG